ncbi:MAG: amidohydrolase family protein [Phycisphaeraceae bacterium]|nr:amidohydrolase family protein [Phycisphaeraceae bacterium]
MTAFKYFIFSFVVVIAMTHCAAAASLAIQAGRIIPVSGPDIENGVILIENQKIKALGTDVVIPDDARLIDASDKTIMPGLIDARSRLFLMDSELNQGGGAPELDVLDALDPFNKDYRQVLAQGVTTVCVVPDSSSMWTCRTALLRLNGTGSVKTMCLKSGVTVKATLGVSRYNQSSSLERLDQYASMREAFIAAQRYLKQQEKYEHALAQYKKDKAKQKDASESKTPLKRPSEPPKSPTYEILFQILRKEIPLQIEVHRVDDIRHALRLAEEFDFAVILDQCTEGYRMAQEIAKHKVPVIVGPVSVSRIDMPALAYQNHDPVNAARLAQAGIQMALGTCAPTGLDSKFLASSAAMAVAQGMDRDAALRAITLTPAQILGVADRIGSLDVGKDADLVICSGDPLDSFTQIEQVLIQGKVVYERKATQ